MGTLAQSVAEHHKERERERERERESEREGERGEGQYGCEPAAGDGGERDADPRALRRGVLCAGEGRGADRGEQREDGKRKVEGRWLFVFVAREVRLRGAQGRRQRAPVL